MRQSNLFTKTRKEAPADETALNARLLIRAGFIHKEIAGAYDYLPLGKRVMDNITRVVREEMNAIDGQEIEMTALQNKELWEASGRFDDSVIDVWFKSAITGGGETGLGNTHEEPITNMMREFIHSHKDLPAAVYQFQTKFRNEKRAKSGIMRGREFLMKDLYSFSRSRDEHDAYYERAKDAYHAIFRRLGIGDRTYLTSASGGSFSPYSHEFQTLCEVGEDTIYLDRAKQIAVNDEIYTDEVLKDLGLEKDKLEKHAAVEVGNIFSLGTKFSDALGLSYLDENNTEQSVIMGSYGIGISRVMGALVELFGGENAMLWPRSVAPFSLHLIQLGSDDGSCAQAERMYETFTENGIAVLWDDRDETAGAKFAESDLIGVPVRLIVSDRARESGGVEVTNRETDETKIMDEATLTSREGMNGLVSE